MRKPALWLCLITAALAACGKAPTPPLDDTASDAAALPDPTPKPASQPALPVPAKLRAVGTEPFWNAEITGTTLIWRTPDFPAGIRITIAVRPARGSIAYSGTLDGKPLLLTITPGPCSDGMSDQIFPYSAVREIGPDIARGCAR